MIIPSQGVSITLSVINIQTGKDSSNYVIQSSVRLPQCVHMQCTHTQPQSLSLSPRPMTYHSVPSLSQRHNKFFSFAVIEYHIKEWLGICTEIPLTVRHGSGQ